MSTPRIEFGALSKPISEQLSEQGHAFDAEAIAHLERDAEAVSRLKVRGVVPHAAGNRAYDKLAKRVWAALSKASGDR